MDYTKTLCKQHIPRTATMTTFSFEHKTHLIDLTDHALICIQLALVVQDLAKSLVATHCITSCCLKYLFHNHILVLMSYCHLLYRSTQSIHQLIHALIMCFYSTFCCSRY